MTRRRVTFWDVALFVLVLVVGVLVAAVLVGLWWPFGWLD